MMSDIPSSKVTDNVMLSPKDITMDSTDTFMYCGVQPSTIQSVVVSCLNIS
jgi:hypothetical protein